MLDGKKCICDKTINIISKSNQNISILKQKHKQKYGIVVNEYDFFKPDIVEVNFVLNDTIKDCRNKYVLSFENRCVRDIKFTNNTNIKEVILSFTL